LITRVASHERSYHQGRKKTCLPPDHTQCCSGAVGEKSQVGREIYATETACQTSDREESTRAQGDEGEDRGFCGEEYSTRHKKDRHEQVQPPRACEEGKRVQSQSGETFE
jgi:hypothetical protein